MTVENTTSVESTSSAPADSMVIDTSNADIFASLIDGVELVEEDTKKESAKEEVEVNEENELDFLGEELPEEGDEGDESEGDDEENNEDKDEVEEEEGEAKEEVEEADEGEEVEYDGYMVNLPDGTEVNLAEAVKGYKNAEAIKIETENFNAQKETFMEGAKDIMNYMELAKLEADKVIDEYADFDWEALSKEDPQRYADNSEFLHRYSERKKELVKGMSALKQKEAEQAQIVFQEQAEVCKTVLQNDLLGWNNDMYGSLLDYAVKNGAQEEDMLKCVDPMIFKLLHKAQQFDNGKSVVKAKVRKKTKSPAKVIKGVKTVKITKSAKKEALIKKIDNGISDGDVFANLVD